MSLVSEILGPLGLRATMQTISFKFVIVGVFAYWLDNLGQIP